MTLQLMFANSIDPDEMAPGGAISSGSMLFVKHPFSEEWNDPSSDHLRVCKGEWVNLEPISVGPEN